MRDLKLFFQKLRRETNASEGRTESTRTILKSVLPTLRRRAVLRHGRKQNSGDLLPPGHHLALGFKPVFDFMAGFASALFVQLVGATANLVLKIGSIAPIGGRCRAFSGDRGNY